MPANAGERPPHDRVDIKFRGGWVARGVDPSKYRWKDDPRFPQPSAGDIVSWQPATPS